MASPSKSLSLVSVVEKNKLASATPFLVTLKVQVINPASGALVETLYLVKNTENLTIGGQLYTATEFDIDLKQESGSQPQITLSMVDYTRAILTKMEQYGGGVGFKVTVGVVNADNLSGPPEIAEYFEVIGASASEYVCQFTLGAESAIARLFPRRLQTKNYCAWRYKDPTTCRYNGALPSCDLTLKGPNGCAAHAGPNGEPTNEANYGAFPGINNSGARYA